jgi:sulfoxide reductase catalytic subunit YedY
MAMRRLFGEPPPSEIASAAQWQAFQARRRLLGAGVALGAGAWAGRAQATASWDTVAEPLTSLELVTRHNNYYEFSTAKDVIWELAKAFKPTPWTLTVEGAVQRPRTWALEDLVKAFAQEDRVYRLRCVEGWSIVVPWRGFSLAALLSASGLSSNAKYVEFVSVLRPSEMIGQRRPSLAWPYREGLRIDEAMHPLTLMVTGLYGQPLPAQNGAPLRLAVPWKYGFKSPKAITHIRLVEQPPVSSWMQAVPSEYGFYANVNPAVAHPRWSQRREHRLGELSKRATLPFNGYAAEVASLYAGMDLEKNF